MGLFVSNDFFPAQSRPKPRGGSIARSSLRSILSVLCSEQEGPFFVPSPAVRFPERAEGVKGPKRCSGAWRLAAVAEVVFRSALTPEHAEGG